jgi:uncharacterized protein with PIN domain
VPIKPTEREEEYFTRLEFERRKKALAEQESRTAEEARLRASAAAKDRCPKCGAPLLPVRYRGVELDKCSGCQGIWLDCGELERILGDEGGFLAGLKRIFQS